MINVSLFRETLWARFCISIFVAISCFGLPVWSGRGLHVQARSLFTVVRNLEQLSSCPRKVSRLCEPVTIYIFMQSTSLFSAARRAHDFYELQTDVLAKTTSMELMFTVLNLARRVHVFETSFVCQSAGSLCTLLSNSHSLSLALVLCHPLRLFQAETCSPQPPGTSWRRWIMEGCWSRCPAWMIPLLFWRWWWSASAPGSGRSPNTSPPILTSMIF